MNSTERRDVDIARQAGLEGTGFSLAQIGREHGLSRQRVHQILIRMGITKTAKIKQRVTHSYFCRICGASYRVGRSRLPGEGTLMHCNRHVRRRAGSVE